MIDVNIVIFTLVGLFGGATIFLLFEYSELWKEIERHKMEHHKEMLHIYNMLMGIEEE